MWALCGVSCFSVSCASIRTKCKVHLQKTNAVWFWGELDIYGLHFFIYPLLQELFIIVPRDWSNEAPRMKICQNSAFHEKFDIVTELFTSPPLNTPLKKKSFNSETRLFLHRSKDLFLTTVAEVSNCSSSSSSLDSSFFFFFFFFSFFDFLAGVSPSTAWRQHEYHQLARLNNF